MTQISDPSAPGFSPAHWLLAVAQEGNYQRALGEFRDRQSVPGGMADFEEDLAWAAHLATPTGVDPKPTLDRLLAEPDVATARAQSEAVQAHRDELDAKVRDLLAGRAAR